MGIRNRFTLVLLLGNTQKIKAQPGGADCTNAINTSIQEYPGSWGYIFDTGTLNLFNMVDDDTDGNNTDWATFLLTEMETSNSKDCGIVGYSLSLTDTYTTPWDGYMDGTKTIIFSGTMTMGAGPSAQPVMQLAHYIRWPRAYEFYVCAEIKDGSHRCSAKVKIVVGCTPGSQFLVSPSSKEIVFPYSASNNLISIASEIATSFQINTPTGTPKCDRPFTYKFYLDSAKAQPFTSDSQVSFVGAQVDGTIIESSQLSVVSTSPINFKTLYVEGINPQIPSQLFQIDIFVCGFETIILSSAINPVIATYNLATGTKSINYSTESSKISVDDNRCPIVSYQIIDSSLNPYSGSQFVLQTGSSSIDVDTSSSFSQSLSLRVSTKGGKIQDIPLDIIICGEETITSTSGSQLSVPINVAVDTGTQTINFSGVAAMMQSSNRCPIVGYEIVDSTYATFGSKVQVSGSDILYDTSGTLVSEQLYLKAYTQDSLNFYYAPLVASSCGSENIVLNSAINQIVATFDLNTGMQQIDYSVENAKITVDDPNCPITSYQLLDSTLAPYQGSQFILQSGSQSINVDTINPFNQALTLRVTTTGGKTQDIPLDIIVCGQETITSSTGSQLSFPFDVTVNTGTQTFDFSSVTNQLLSSISRCPIFGFEIVDSTYTSFGTKVQVSGTLIQYDTATSLVGEQLYIKAFTKSSSNFYYIPIISCGQESISLSSAISTVAVTYNKGIGTKSVDFSSESSKISVNDPSCPIISYMLLDSALNTYTGTQFIVQAANLNIDVDTATSFSQPLTLRLMTKGGKIQDIPLDILICGQETITSSSGTQLSLVISVTANTGTQLIDFTSVFSQLLTSNSRCPIVGYEIVDSSYATFGPKVSIVGSNIQYDTTGSLVTEQLYIKAYTQSSPSFYYVPLNHQVCGSENIILTSSINPIVATFDRGTVIQTVSYQTESTKISVDDVNCPVLTYEILDSSLNPYLATQFVVNTGSQSIDVDTTLSFSSALTLRATTAGGITQDIPLDLLICGEETITSPSGSNLDLKLNVISNSGTQLFDFTPISSSLQSSNARCPIVGYEIVDSSYAAFGPQVTVSGLNIQYDTSSPIVTQQLYLKVFTKSSTQFYYVPLQFTSDSCGSETISQSDTINVTLQYQQNSGIQQYDITSSIAQKLISSLPDLCPITQFTLFEADKTTQVPSNHQVQLSSKLLSIDTSQILNKTYTIRVQTQKSTNYFWAPISVQIKATTENVPAAVTKPKFDPFFISDPPKTLNINLNVTNYYVIEVPKVFDYNNDVVDLEIEGLNNETIYYKEGKVIISGLSQKDIGIKRLVFKLKDSNGGFKEYYTEVVIFFKEIKNNNNNNNNPLEQNQKKPEIVYNITVQKEQKEYFNAQISKIDPDGYVTVEFSKPLRRVDLNRINETMQLFMEPSNQTIINMGIEDPFATFQTLNQSFQEDSIMDKSQIQSSPFSDRILIRSSEYLNFTWVPVDFKPQRLVLKIDFKFSLNVSTSENLRDQLVIHFRDPLFFRGEDLSFQNNTILFWPVRRQFVQEPMTETLVVATQKIMESIMGIGIGAFVLNSIFLLTLQLIIQTFQNIQIVLFHTMINLQTPANALFFLWYLKKIINFELFDPEQTTEVVLDLKNDDMLMQEISTSGEKHILLNENLVDMGFENYSPILNIGGLILQFIGYLFFLLISLVLKLILQILDIIDPKLKKISLKKRENQELQIIEANHKYQDEIIRRAKKAIRERKGFEGGEDEDFENQTSCISKFHFRLTNWYLDLTAKLFFRVPILMINETFLQLLIAGFLWLERIRLVSTMQIENNLTEKAQNVLGFLAFALPIGLTILHVFITCCIDIDSLNSKKYENRFGMIITKLKRENKTQLLYNNIFTIRRIMICLTALFVKYTGIQIQIFLFLNVFSVIYVGNVQPFRTRQANKNELFSEFMTITILSFSTIFTDYCQYPLDQYQYGWTFIVMILFTILYFIYFIVAEICWYLKLTAIKLLKKIGCISNESKKKPKIEAGSFKTMAQDIPVNILQNQRDTIQHIIDKYGQTDDLDKIMEDPDEEDKQSSSLSKNEINTQSIFNEMNTNVNNLNNYLNQKKAKNEQKIRKDAIIASKSNSYKKVSLEKKLRIWKP